MGPSDGCYQGGEAYPTLHCPFSPKRDFRWFRRRLGVFNDLWPNFSPLRAYFKYVENSMFCVAIYWLFFLVVCTSYYWREVVHVDDLSLQNDPAREKILLGEAVLGKVQIGSSARKILKF